MNLTITNNDVGSVIHQSGVFSDDILVSLSGTYPLTVLAGTILARSASSGNLIIYLTGGTTFDDGIAKTVLTYDVEFLAAGGVPVRTMQSGIVNGNRLIIDADGDNSNVTTVLLEELRDYGIQTVDAVELNLLDNQ